MFVDLHLSDEDGYPLYALENGFYYWQELKGITQFNKDPKPENFDVLKNHLRISNEETVLLIGALDMALNNVRNYEEIKKKHKAVAEAYLSGIKTPKEIFSNFVNEQKERWNKEANEAKEYLKELINGTKKI